MRCPGLNPGPFIYYAISLPTEPLLEALDFPAEIPADFGSCAGRPFPAEFAKDLGSQLIPSWVTVS